MPETETALRICPLCEATCGLTLTIDATDIDRGCLERAQAARYSSGSLADFPAGLAQRYFEQDVLFREMLAKHTRTEGNVVISDLRGVDPIYCGNRFLVYALYPEQNCSIWIVSGLRNQNCVFACGQSIVNRTANGTPTSAMSRTI